MDDRINNITSILEGLNESSNEMTKEKFLDYVRIQMSGVTNMFDVNRVCKLSKEGLTKDDCIDIMKNYDKYRKQWSKNIKESTINESTEKFSFIPHYGCKIISNFGDIDKDTLFYCDEVNNSNKTVTLSRQDNKSYKITVPIKFAEKMFVAVSGLTRGESYITKAEIVYSPVSAVEDMEWPEKFVNKYTKKKFGDDWIVFPKGTKFFYFGQTQSGDDFEVDGQYVPISDVELLNGGAFKDYTDVFKM